MTTISFKLEDEALEAFLDDQENRSEVIREAIRRQMYQEVTVEDGRLTDEQRQSYEWFRRYAGVGEAVDLEVAVTVLAQQLSLKKELVKVVVLRPLERLGYLRVGWYGMESVRVRVEAPPTDSEAVLEYEGESASGGSESAEEGGLAVDDHSRAGERMEELAEADIGR